MFKKIKSTLKHILYQAPAGYEDYPEYKAYFSPTWKSLSIIPMLTCFTLINISYLFIYIYMDEADLSNFFTKITLHIPILKEKYLILRKFRETSGYYYIITSIITPIMTIVQTYILIKLYTKAMNKNPEMYRPVNIYSIPALIFLMAVIFPFMGYVLFFSDVGLIERVSYRARSIHSPILFSILGSTYVLLCGTVILNVYIFFVILIRQKGKFAPIPPVSGGHHW